MRWTAWLNPILKRSSNSVDYQNATFTKLLLRKGIKLEASVATLGRFHPFGSEEGCSCTMLITVKKIQKKPSKIIHHMGPVKRQHEEKDNGKCWEVPGGRRL